jgi:hypothetical protein
VFFAAGFTAASCFSSPASAASEPVYLLLLQPSAGAFSPVRSPELPSYRGCVHHIATQQLGLTVFTVAELKRTQPPVPLARMSEYVLLPGTTYHHVILSALSSGPAISGIFDL